MKILSTSNGSHEHVYQGLRELSGQRVSQTANRSALRALRAWLDLGSERIAQLLDSRFVLSLAACLALVIVAYLSQRAEKNLELAPTQNISSDPEPTTPGGEAPDVVGDVKD